MKEWGVNFKQKCADHWHRIGIFRKTIEVLVALLLLFLTVPSNSVRAAIALEGHPQLAMKVNVTKASAGETRYVLGKYHIGCAYEIDRAYLDPSGSFEVGAFHVTRIILINVAYPVPYPG